LFHDDRGKLFAELFVELSLAAREFNTDVLDVFGWQAQAGCAFSLTDAERTDSGKHVAKCRLEIDDLVRTFVKIIAQVQAFAESGEVRAE